MTPATALTAVTAALVTGLPSALPRMAAPFFTPWTTVWDITVPKSSLGVCRGAVATIEVWLIRFESMVEARRFTACARANPRRLRTQRAGSVRAARPPSPSADEKLRALQGDPHC